MTQVNMHEAKSNFSKLVELALQGEEVVVARNGRPLVKLVPIDGPAGLRPVGLHRQEVGEDFETRSLEPLSAEELAEWHTPALLDE